MRLSNNRTDHNGEIALSKRRMLGSVFGSVRVYALHVSHGVLLQHSQLCVCVCVPLFLCFMLFATFRL